MPSEQGVEGAVNLHVENVGGITSTEVSFDPGVVILSGRNATNRTSLLRAIMAALGSDDVTLRGGTDQGEVELSIGESTYNRTLVRRDGALVCDGDPYLDDPELADLFAFLLESNEARRSVLRHDDLRELVMRPVDTATIETRIEELEDRRRELDEDLEELDRLENELAAKEAERHRLAGDLEEVQDQLAQREADQEAADRSIEQSHKQQSELDEQLEKLEDARSTLRETEEELDIERRTVEALRQERSEVQTHLDENQAVSGDEIEEVTARIDSLRDQKQRVESEITELLRIIKFNEELLAGEREVSPPAMGDGKGGSVTDRLLEDGERVRCWTCGSEVVAGQVEQTINHLRERRERLAERRNEVRQELEELTDRRQRLERRRDERHSAARRLDELEEDLADHEEALTTLEARRTELQDRIDDLEETVDDLDDRADYGEVLEIHREVNELEFESGRLQDRIDDIDGEIASLKARLEDREHLEAQREEVESELADLRTRVDRIERGVVETFNQQMETVLDLMDYDNIERIWLERVETEGPSAEMAHAFRLHVVRSTEADTVYEDTIDHLSESEREVTGLVFALAGYLAHDVHERVPFVLLDSLEAIDAQRISAFVEHFSEYADFLVVTLLTEDAQALDDGYQRITDI